MLVRDAAGTVQPPICPQAQLCVQHGRARQRGLCLMVVWARKAGAPTVGAARDGRMVDGSGESQDGRRTGGRGATRPLQPCIYRLRWLCYNGTCAGECRAGDLGPPPAARAVRHARQAGVHVAVD